MLEFFTSLALNMSLINNFLLLAFFFTFAIVFWRESKDKNSVINWTDLLVDEAKGGGRGKVSLTKLGHFWGIAIASWVVIYMAQKISPDQIAAMFPWIFGSWLTWLTAQTGIKAYKAFKTSENVPIKEEKNVE